jgi:peroxiredoxin
MKWIASITLAVCLLPAVWAQAPVPRPANGFHFTDSSGKTIDTKDDLGTVLIIQFLYTTCSHCQATARMLSGLEKELGPHGLRVVGVAFNPGAQVDEFVKNNAIDFPVGTASPDSVLGYLGISAMDRFGVPQIVVIDRGGTIRAQSGLHGSAELQDENYLRTFLEGLLKR